MAAPDGIVWGSIVGSYGRIGIYKKLSSTSTTTTVNVEVWFWSKFSVTDSSNTFYFDNRSSSGSATTSKGSVSISTTSDSGGWSETNQKKIASYSYEYTRGTSAVTRYLHAKLTGIDRVGGTMTASTTFSVPTLSSYTVSYNANGGSGAPSSQTKWYGKTLTLSSTTPTRTGYSFQGWATTASGSVAYAEGASYTGNAAVTLYAVWKANTYTVKYDANGGTGAPTSQAKTYGSTLTLSSTKPTRTNYNFKGWATSASSTSATYAAGGSYTTDADITLFAVWELAYTKPRITGFSVSRCDSNSKETDTGTYALAKFSWKTDKTVSSIVCSWVSASGASGSATISASGTSGTVSSRVGGNFATDQTYTLTVKVTDSGGFTDTSSTLSGTAFVVDFLAGGNGVAFGKPAEKEGVAQFAFDLMDKHGAMIRNGLVAYESGEGIDANTTIEECFLTMNNAPTSNQFWYIHQYFYSSKSATANRMQVAYPYKVDAISYHRYYVNGTWSAWLNEGLAAYPVGSYYISANATSPASLFGGTWHRIESRFLWAAPADSTLGATAGEMTHTLEENEIPSHRHTIVRPKWYAADGGSNGSTLVSENSIYGATGTTVNAYKTSLSHSGGIQAAGGGEAHNNMPPYVNVAIWRREA